MTMYTTSGNFTHTGHRKTVQENIQAAKDAWERRKATWEQQLTASRQPLDPEVVHVHRAIKALNRRTNREADHLAGGRRYIHDWL